MKIAAFVLLAGLMLAAAPPAMALTPHTPVFIDLDAGAQQTVKPGEDFFVALPSNVTTGYAWTSAVSDDKIVSYEGNVYQRPGTANAGAGGQQLFIFHANRSGTATVTFSYARSFESGTPPAKTLTFTIAVQ